MLTSSSGVFYADRAWLSADHGEAKAVTITVHDGLISDIQTGQTPPINATILPGLVIPGLVNAHSHAFHRALRGRTQLGSGDFWSWRQRMYSVLGELNPDRYLALARATYAEMALAGITTVTEFHYVHHDLDGKRYNGSPMEQALAQAAADVGIRLTLLDTCYLQADVDGTELSAQQRRFGDGTMDSWRERVDSYANTLPGVTMGAAIHSVRACDPDTMNGVADWATSREAPLHIHLSEQPRENTACLEVYGKTPTQLCADAGVLGPATTAVHATHLTNTDITLLGESRTMSCFCPTTERDLADGVGPSTRLAVAGSPLCVGSDSHAVIDLFEEARAIELNERLVSLSRGNHRPADLLRAATEIGAASAGLPSGWGRIAVDAAADFIAVNTSSVRLAGVCDADSSAVVFAATASDVTDVVCRGRQIVSGGMHVSIEDVPLALSESIRAVNGWSA